MPIINLVHVTHNAKAQEICENAKEYKFKVRQKLGKVLGAYDGRPCGESFWANQDKTIFTQITDDEPVFPGFYSWWSIYPTETDESDSYTSVAKVKKAIDDDFLSGISSVINYLQAEPPESRYGNNGFVANFQSLLNVYARSRGADIGNVYIRNGGTLRYSFEICYVIIVCTNEDNKALKDFDPLTSSPEFKMNELIDSKGKIKNPAAIPTFCPKYVIENMSFGKCSYETTAFAFYFPSVDRTMSMRPGAECNRVPIEHIEVKCVKKQPKRKQPKGTEWLCPNKLQKDLRL